MGFDSLYTGISGLNAYQSWIDLLSNNIANIGTYGFKGQRMTFADQFYNQIGYASGPTTTNGGVNPQEIGLGVKVNTIDTLFNQGGLETTGVNTDLAINGNGFFVLANANGTGTPSYTRSGAFSLNQNGLLYDPGSGLAVQGYMANAQGQISASGTPGAITIPLGQQEQATGTGFGVKTGPTATDKVFDVSFGGNLDQTQWAQALNYSVGGAPTNGTPYTISTTIYDSLGVAHQATITYTPDAAGATPATTAVTAGTAGNIATVSVSPTTQANDTIQITVNGTGTAATLVDTNSGAVVTASAGSTIQIGADTVTLAGALTATSTTTLGVTGGTSGLPKSVTDASGNVRTPATRWKVSVSFADGTTFQTIKTPGSVAAGGAVTAPTYGTGTSGTLGYAYFDQNGQFINTSSIETAAAGTSIGGAAQTGDFHVAGALTSIQQGNQLNVTSWGPGTGNNSVAPTAGGGTPALGPIGLDFSNNASLAGTYTANTLTQNGYQAGILSNITVGQDGTITGSFTNGQQKALAQVALATFQNEQGLNRIGSNFFQQTANSGLAQVGAATTGSLGAIVSGALEQSNVSLADQFTKMIAAQRAFEANTRGITTADQNLITVTHLQASEN